MSTELELATDVVKRVRDEGGRALFVGGWVRDRLSDRPSKDIDIEVYGLEANRLRALLERIGRVNTVGESFTVYKLGPLDVSLPRRESKTGHGHRGFTVSGDPTLPVVEAARRRDFTINAIAWDPMTDEYLDPYHGRDDLTRGVLRVVDPETFADDSLRVLRAIQFAARFDLRIDNATRTLCQGIPLDDLPAERIWGEVEKLLMRSRRPSVGFQLALELRIVERLFPEMAVMVGCEQEPEWHPEGDVWTHTLLVIDQAATHRQDLSYARQVALMLSAVCHDLGKPATTEFIEGRIRSRNHEAAGVGPTERLLDRLNIHTLDGYNIRRQVVGLVACHLTPGMWHRAPQRVGDGAFRRLARKVELELLGRLAKADCLGRTGEFDCTAMDWFLERATTLGIEREPPPRLLLGRHVLALGLRPGPAVGRVLAAVYEQQLDGAVTSLQEAIEAAQSLVAASEQVDHHGR